MPYRFAHWYLLSLLAFTVFAFWPSFFGLLGSAERTPSMRVHLHTWPALAWVLLMSIQIWSVQTGRLGLHRLLGKASYVLFPFLIAGLVAILDIAAKTFVEFYGSPFNILGPALMYTTGIPILTCMAFYFLSMTSIRNVRKHAGYLLAIPILLIESPVSRVLKQNLPSLQGENLLDDFQKILVAVEWGLWLAIVVAISVWLFDRVHRRPFLFVAIVCLLQILGARYLSGTEATERLLLFSGNSPTWINYSVGLVLGAGISLYCWLSRSKAPAKSAPAL